MPVPAIAASTGEIRRATEAHKQRPRGIDPHDLAVALELPQRHHLAAEAATQAGVAQQVARVVGPAAAIEIGRSGGGGETLDARTVR
jgi:hypothetical protein